MEDQNIQINNDDFIKLPRSIRSAYLDRLLSLDEMWVLIWLWINATPRTGQAMVSYEGLSKDFKLRYSKNVINKLMLALKRKKLIWFPNQQGRRSSFHVDIANYPLSNKSIKTIAHRFEATSGRSSDHTPGSIQAEVQAEVTPAWQKLERQKKHLVKGFSASLESSSGRGYKNDNDKENKNNYRSAFSNSSKRIGFSEFTPQSYEEQRCMEIAQYLGEQDMTFILSVLKNHGFNVIEKAYNEVKERPAGSIDKKGAYFNKLVNKFIRKVD